MSRSKKGNKPKQGTIPPELVVHEPDRKTLYDALCYNLSEMKRRNYVQRVIYIGEHHFKFDINDISNFFEKIISDINNGYCDEKLSGLLLYYSKYFCHVIEGSEDSIQRHFQMFLSEESKNMFSRMKLLVTVHNINQRFFEEWFTYSGKPATLVEKIDFQADMEKTNRYVLNCIQKMYNLCIGLREVTFTEDSERVSGVAEEAFSYDSSMVERPSRLSAVYEANAKITNALKQYLPEFNLLEFLITTKHVKDLEDVINLYGDVKQMDPNRDKVWPVISNHFPYNIYDKVVDPVIDLPLKDDKTRDDLSEVVLIDE